MGFLAPWFLAGLAAIGLPVYLHLLRRHQQTPQKFSSIMFFERRTESSVKHRRLDYIVLFAMRAAMVFLLALAFANPFYTREVVPGQEGQRTVVLAVDHSFSMRAGGNLDRAKAQATEMAAGAPSGARLQVLAFGGGVQFIGEATEDRGAAQAAIASIEPTHSRSSFGELARAIRSVSEEAPGPVEVHIYSDMQKSALPGSFSDLRLEPGTTAEFHATAPLGKAPENWTVETVMAPARLYGQASAKIQATVAGYNTPSAERTVSLLLNGKTLKSQTAKIPENGRTTVEFSGVEAPYGLNRGEVRIEGADVLQDDNRFFFALPRLEQSRVLLVHGASDRRSPVYVASALQASANAAFIVDPASAGQAATLDLKKFAVVILADPGSVSGAFQSSLQTYLEQGGGVLLAAGANTAVENRTGLLGVKLAASEYTSREGDIFQSVAQVDTTHPVLRSATSWDGVRIFRYTKAEAPNSRVIARLSDQSPLVVELNPGQGRLLVFTSSFDNISNDLPLQPVFVPFLEQAAYYLSGVQQASTTLAVDSYLDLRAGVEKGVQVEIVDAAGQRPLSLAEASSLESWQIREEGFYEVRRGAAPAELVAANADRRESDLQPVEQETLELWKNTGTAEAAAGPGGVAVEKRPMEFWWYLLLALLAVALAESIYGSRYLHQEREAA